LAGQGKGGIEPRTMEKDVFVNTDDFKSEQHKIRPFLTSNILCSVSILKHTPALHLPLNSGRGGSRGGQGMGKAERKRRKDWEQSQGLGKRNVRF